VTTDETQDYSLADDILRGAQAIGDFIGLDEERERRRVYYLLQTGAIDATKEGTTWVSTKSRLRRQYNESRYQPPVKEPEAEPVKPPKRKRAA
jgi:hypothetical protein